MKEATMVYVGIRNGGQLRAARALAGLSQAALAQLAGLHENSVRRLEQQEVITAWHSPVLVEEVLRNRGVVCFAKPTIGVRYAEPEMSETDTFPGP